VSTLLFALQKLHCSFPIQRVDTMQPDSHVLANPSLTHGAHGVQLLSQRKLRTEGNEKQREQEGSGKGS